MRRAWYIYIEIETAVALKSEKGGEWHSLKVALYEALHGLAVTMLLNDVRLRTFCLMYYTQYILLTHMYLFTFIYNIYIYQHIDVSAIWMTNAIMFVFLSGK